MFIYIYFFSYLTQSQVNGSCFRDVHDFAVGRHDENETVQGLFFFNK